MGAAFARKYNTLLVTGTTAIRIPLIKRGVVDFAVGADYTPSAGDVKVHIDGAAAANITNLPTAVASGNTAFWEFILTAAELSSKQTHVSIADSATKVIEDQAFIVETFGNASAMYAADLSAANLPANVAQWNGTAVATPATAGVPDINVKNVNNVAATSVTTVNANMGTTQPVNFTGTGASALAKSDTVDWAGTAVATPDTAGYVKATIKDGTGTGELDTTSGKVALKDASFGAATLDGTFVFLDENDVAAAIGNLALAAHTDPGSLGQVLQAINVDTFNTAAAVDTEVPAIKTVTDQFVFGTANRVNVQVYGMQPSVIDAAAIATDAITAAKIATNAIDADALAPDAIAEINATVDTALADYDAPTNAELATALATADDATLAAIAALNNLSQANVRSAVGLGSANLDTQLDALPTSAELAVALGTADDATLVAIAALNNLSAAQVNAEVDTALADINLDHLLKVAAVAGDVINSSVIARLVSKSATPAFSSFDNTTDSLEAISDDGGGGGGGACDSEAIADLVVAGLSASGTPAVTYQSGYNFSSGTITVPYGADFLEDSELGVIPIPVTVAGVDISLAGATLKFSVKLASTGTGRAPLFTVTSNSGADLNEANLLPLNASNAQLALTTAETTLLGHGHYIWDAWLSKDGIDVPFAAGKYIVSNTVTLPTTPP